MAWSISDQRRSRPNWQEERLPFIRRAFELSDKTSERERYLIRGSYFMMTDQGEKGVANYKALLQLDPDHYAANNNLYLYYLFRSAPPSIEEGHPYLLRAAQLRPNSLRLNFAAGYTLATQMNRPREAAPYLQRLADLAEIAPSFVPGNVNWARLYPAHMRWLEGDLEGVISEVDRWRETLRSISGRPNWQLASQMGHFYRGLGMLEAAEELYRLTESPNARDNMLDEAEYYRMDEEEGVAFLKRQGTLTRTRGHGARRLARAGLLSEARDELASFQAQARQETDPVRKYRDDIALILTQGEIALAEGNAEEAISLLQEGVAAVRNSGRCRLFPRRRIPGKRMGAAGRPRHGLANVGRRLSTEEPSLPRLRDFSTIRSQCSPVCQAALDAGPAAAGPALSEAGPRSGGSRDRG